MMTKPGLAWIAVVAACAALGAEAHHNSTPIYDHSKSIMIEGTVTSFQFINPHARIRLNVVGTNGAVEEWLAEGANAVMLRHNGWAGTEIKSGDTIKLTGAPSRDGSLRMEWREIVTAVGQVLGGGNGFPKEEDELIDRLEKERAESAGRD
jgi:hypothetical protein